MFPSLLLFGVLAGATTALAASTPTAAASLTGVAAIEYELKHALHEEQKAKALLRRSFTYGNNTAARHKQAVFSRRVSEWASEASSVSSELVAMGETVSAKTTAAVAYATSIVQLVAPTTVPVTSSSPAPSVTSTSRFITATRTSSATTTTTVPSSTTTTTTTTTTTAAPTTTTTSVSTTTSSSAAAASSSTSSSSSSKKGGAFNDLLSVEALGTSITWAYNWGQTATGLSAGVEFVPLIWSNTRDLDTWMTDAQAGIDSGSTWLAGFNEPDQDTQANMSIAETVAGWQTYMSPFVGKAKLLSPAVTNGADPMGITYLSNFAAACSSCWDEVDAVALHWYDAASNTAYFKEYFERAYTTLQKDIWITEFQGSGTVAEQQAFLEEVIPWMEEQDYILRYSAYGDFVGTFVDDAGALLALGATYANTV